MSKRVYISADYSENDGDRDVVEELHTWGRDNKHKVDYVDTAQVVSGSVSEDEDCRPCDLKEEFNRQINASSAVIFIIGDKTASRTAGSYCKRNSEGKHYYFLAINDVNKFGKPENQDYTNVDTALNGLLESINKVGHCDNLAMPLIGTGKAAIREATLENVIEDMIDRFVNSHDKIVQKLIISIRPKDYLDDKVDLKKVKKYMEYKCEFK